jgi:hypothetical protein
MKASTAARLSVAFFTLLLFILIACQKETNNGAAPRVKIYLTDHQTPIFDRVFIDMQKLEVQLQDETLSNGGWVAMSIRPGIYNILRFRNGPDTLFATGTLPNDRVRKIRLTLGTQNTVMRNGQSSSLKIEDNERQVVIDLSAANFDITSGQMSCWLDFDAVNSIRVDNSGSGNNNGFELTPRIKAFGRTTTGCIEGKVSPLAANAIVKAYRGADTATAIPNGNKGEFKIVGLDAGTYTVLIDGQNGFRDTTIAAVRVANREDTKLGVITLRP